MLNQFEQITNSQSSEESALHMCETICSALESAKGDDILIINVKEMTDITDYIIIVTGTSNRHIKTLMNKVIELMRKQGWSHFRVEGEKIKDWVLIDFIDVLVHIMQQSTRNKYNIEGIWNRDFLSSRCVT